MSHPPCRHPAYRLSQIGSRRGAPGGHIKPSAHTGIASPTFRLSFSRRLIQRGRRIAQETRLPPALIHEIDKVHTCSPEHPLLPQNGTPARRTTFYNRSFIDRQKKGTPRTMHTVGRFLNKDKGCVSYASKSVQTPSDGNRETQEMKQSICHNGPRAAYHVMPICF